MVRKVTGPPYARRTGSDGPAGRHALLRYAYGSVSATSRLSAPESSGGTVVSYTTTVTPRCTTS